MADETPDQPVEEQAAVDNQIQPVESGDAEPEAQADVQNAIEVQDVGSDEGQELAADEVEDLRANEATFDWEASEYVHHHKGVGWYAGLTAGIAILVAIAALLRYWLEIGALLIMGVAIVVYARRPPRVLKYELTPQGITVDGRDIPFTEFRSFGIISDDDWHTIDLMPTKRFSPRIGILFEDSDFDTIVGHLELHLPRVDRDPDLVERLTRMLRF